jgi:hypothetical protein
MTNLEGAHLAQAIANGWPTRGVPADTWAADIRDLDPGTVRDTLTVLRHELDRPPTVAQFIRRYREVRAEAAEPEVHEGTCTACDGCGSVRDDMDIVFGTPEEIAAGRGRVVQQVTWCRRCRAGAAARLAHARVVRDGMPPTAPHQLVPADSYHPEAHAR